MTTAKYPRSFMSVQVDPDEKQAFFETCDRLSINPSAWIRKQMAAFVEQNKEDDPK